MLDIRLLREQPDFVKQRLAARDAKLASAVDEILACDQQRRAAETRFQQLQADRDRLSQENERLRTQLAAVRGEREPVSFGGDADTALINEPTAKQKAALGSGLAKFAANIRLPSKI